MKLTDEEKKTLADAFFPPETEHSKKLQTELTEEDYQRMAKSITGSHALFRLAFKRMLAAWFTRVVDHRITQIETVDDLAKNIKAVVLVVHYSGHRKAIYIGGTRIKK